jgi:[acyl-carrier-protein] S-malonyltransferase
VIPLKVAGAFHSPFMAPAADDLRVALQGMEFAAPEFPVWANVTAAPHGGAIGPVLADQLMSPVRFQETLSSMAGTGITDFVHVGPGDVTAGLAARSIEGGGTHVVSDLEQAEAVAAALSGG